MATQHAPVAGRAPVAGTSLAYEVIGPGDGDWIVFAHGGEGTRLHWWQQVAHFAVDRRCLIYDARGHGASPGGPAPTSDNPMRDDLLALLDHIGIVRATMIGHSMGGLAVSGLARSHPSRVERLIMSDSPFGFATAELAAWAADMIVRIDGGFAVLDHLYAPGFADREPALSYLYQALNRLNPPRLGPTGMAAYETWRDQPAGDYRAFAVPALFIVGAMDALTPPPLITATARAIGGARLVEIAGAGHSTYAERADAYNDAIGEFCLRT